MVAQETMISPMVDRKSEIATYNSKLGEQVAPCQKWLSLCEQANQVFDDNFSVDWLISVLSKVAKDETDTEEEEKDKTTQLVEDEKLLSDLTKVCSMCFTLVYNFGDKFDNLVSSQGPALAARMFKKELGRGQRSEVVQNEAPDLLENVVFPAFKAAVKLGLDHVNYHVIIFFFNM